MLGTQEAVVSFIDLSSYRGLGISHPLVSLGNKNQISFHILSSLSSTLSWMLSSNGPHPVVSPLVIAYYVALLYICVCACVCVLVCVLMCVLVCVSRKREPRVVQSSTELCRNCPQSYSCIFYLQPVQRQMVSLPLRYFAFKENSWLREKRP